VIMDLGKSVVIKGELSASEDFTLYGQMEGRVTLPDHTLTIGPAANIRASISAKAVVIMGAVTGNVAAAEKVEIAANADGTVTVNSSGRVLTRTTSSKTCRPRGGPNLAVTTYTRCAVGSSPMFRAPCARRIAGGQPQTSPPVIPGSFLMMVVERVRDAR